MEIKIPDQLSTLGHPQRLAIFRLLMRRYPDRVPAGEIATALGVKASTMSAYLALLMRADLVRQRRAGTSMLYSINMTTVQSLFGYLFSDCCRGRPDICMPFSTGTVPMPDRKHNVLFICVGNSARSIFAESVLRKTAGDRFNAYSAGTRPASRLNPFAMQLLQDKGHDISVLRSKDISEFSGPDAPHFDFVFTVCDQAANEECPAWEGQPVSGHWGIPDPARATGNDAQKALAFHRAYRALKHRIGLFTALNLESLNRIAIQNSVDEIGRANLEERA
ncbi:arsenate reductase/protein-tyrosine-phosphatase family protein [Paracoccus seriniphilus]|uniref:arsenate reductase/protein-tyrosine-phosphatase family protein n=1 Tax=Paracoccus seriniphilus TaxID=184748 RepID=UPI00356A7000